MLENNLIGLIIKDILATGEYTLEGIARYTNHHHDTVYEAVIGYNKYPSAVLLRRVVDLHREVRGDLYHELIKKIKAQLAR